MEKVEFYCFDYFNDIASFVSGRVEEGVDKLNFSFERGQFEDFLSASGNKPNAIEHFKHIIEEKVSHSLNGLVEDYKLTWSDGFFDRIELHIEVLKR